MTAWVTAGISSAVGELLPRAYEFATSRGPLDSWLSAAQRVREGGATLEVLWVLCRLASQAGEPDLVLDTATEIVQLAQDAADPGDRARALGEIADVLVIRGSLDNALYILREEILPVVEHLGDIRARTATLKQIADILATRGEIDTAVQICREQAAPIVEGMPTLTTIADDLADRKAIGALGTSPTCLPLPTSLTRR